MNGFLQRLGARAIGAANIVPRAHSLFEPSSAVPAAPVRSDVPSATTAEISVKHATRVEIAPQVETVRAVMYERASPRELPRATSSSVTPKISKDSREESRAERSRTPSQLLDVRANTRQSPKSDDGTPRDAMAVRSIRESPTPVLVVRQPLPVPAARAAAVPPQRSRMHAPLRPDEAVHVTIGRVEVRAVSPPPATPPTARKQTATLGLDEYLRNRGRP